MTVPRPLAPGARGRPRDPALEDRIVDAALAVYSERGWAGFSLEAVARGARVGREAIYRRWATKAELLAHAVEVRAPVLPEVDTGTTAGDLAELAWHFLDSYREPHGVVGLRMVLDARSVPELAERFESMLRGERAERTRRVVARALERGDLPPGTSVTTVVEVLTGATLTHVLYAAPAQGGGRRPAADSRHVTGLVALLLSGPRGRGD